ncbi:MAG: tetratricopeptide repeat protein, partial [Desulfobacterales bacterium]
MAFRVKYFTMAMVSVFVFAACGPKLLIPKTRLDTPVHHVHNGMKLLKLDKFEAAFREFNRASELDPKLSSPYVGMGLVYGHQGRYEKGLNSIRKADRLAIATEQKVATQVGYMRLYIIGREKMEKNWLKLVEDAFLSAKTIDVS